MNTTAKVLMAGCILILLVGCGTHDPIIKHTWNDGVSADYYWRAPDGRLTECGAVYDNSSSFLNPTKTAEVWRGVAHRSWDISRDYATEEAARAWVETYCKPTESR